MLHLNAKYGLLANDHLANWLRSEHLIEAEAVLQADMERANRKQHVPTLHLAAACLARLWDQRLDVHTAQAVLADEGMQSRLPKAAQLMDACVQKLYKV